MHCQPPFEYRTRVRRPEIARESDGSPLDSPSSGFLLFSSLARNVVPLGAVFRCGRTRRILPTLRYRRKFFLSVYKIERAREYLHSFSSPPSTAWTAKLIPSRVSSPRLRETIRAIRAQKSKMLEKWKKSEAHSKPDETDILFLSLYGGL